MKTAYLLVIAAIAGVQSIPGRTQEAVDAQATARLAKNPFAGVISVPFIYDANLGGGLRNKTQEVLNIQPVVPFDLNEDWDLITRTIVPLIAEPALPGSSGARGLGDIQLSAFLSPARVGRLNWGVGPVFQFRSATNSALGQGKWGAGPTAAAIWSGDRWTIGAIVNNIWSFAGDGSRAAVNQMQLQPLVTYFFPDDAHRFITSSPTITANWRAKGDERWTVPVSLGVGQVVNVGAQPVNLQATAYYNFIRPGEAATWTVELQVQFVFAK